jgi:hypothetical protein
VVLESLLMTIQCFKGDQEGEGQVTAVRRTGTETCPVVAYEAWIAAAGIHTAPRSTYSSGHPRSRNFTFNWRSGSWSVLTGWSSMSPSGKVYTRINFRLTVLAISIAVLSFTVEEVLIFRMDIWDHWFADPRIKHAFYAVTLVPLVEETMRVNVVRWAERRQWLTRPESLATALTFGVLIGCAEWVTKSAFLDPALTLNTALGLIIHMSSLAIHPALSAAFFSFRSERFVKTLALHCLINATILGSGGVLIAYGLSYSSSPVGYTAALLAVVCILSGVVAARPIYVLRRQPASDHIA